MASNHPEIKLRSGDDVRLCEHEGCCPTVAVNDREVLIRDDYGGVVRLTLKEFNILKRIEVAD